MIDIQTIAAIIFVIALTIFVYLKRKNLDTKQIIPYFLYFSMYKTKLGLKLMDSISKKYRKFVLYIGYFGIFIGFVGMAFIAYSLISNLYVLFTQPQAAPGVGLVLPVKAKGVFFVPFFYWIIAIFVIAVVHEFSHGLLARAYNMKVKSSGFAFLGTGFRVSGLTMIFFSAYIKMKNNQLFSFDWLNLFNYSSPDFWVVIGLLFVILSFIQNLSKVGYLPIIPAAFVEPDEKELRKRPHKEQLSVFAAGPLANIVFAFLFLAVAYLVFTPIANAMIEPNGVKITDYVEAEQKFPAETAGIKIGEVIKEIDNQPTPYLDNVSAILKSKKPGNTILIATEKSSYQLTLAKNPENESAAYMGAFLEQSTKIKDNVSSTYGEFLPNSIVWIYGLFIILFILNLGIGLFNLVPIGPLDGGRMLQLVLHKIFDVEKGNKVLSYVGIFFLVIVFVNIVAAFVK